MLLLRTRRAEKRPDGAHRRVWEDLASSPLAGRQRREYGARPYYSIDSCRAYACWAYGVDYFISKSAKMVFEGIFSQLRKRAFWPAGYLDWGGMHYWSRSSATQYLEAPGTPVLSRDGIATSSAALQPAEPSLALWGRQGQEQLCPCSTLRPTGGGLTAETGESPRGKHRWGVCVRTFPTSKPRYSYSTAVFYLA
jgi:hypothetical protein